MALTRDFKELVQKHVADDPAFAENSVGASLDRILPPQLFGRKVRSGNIPVPPAAGLTTAN